MNILRVCDTKILNFKSARSLLSFFVVRSYLRALLCEWRLELWGASTYITAKSPNISDLSKSVLYLSTDFTSDQVERVHNHSTKSG
jgi:hypothetical protein